MADIKSTPPKGIDLATWQKILELLPALAVPTYQILAAILEAFKKQPMTAVGSHCDEHLCACCKEAIDLQVGALLKMVHLHCCCAPKE